MATDLSNLILLTIVIFVVLYTFILSLFRRIKLFFQRLFTSIIQKNWKRYVLLFAYILALYIEYSLKLNAIKESGFTIIACVFTVTMLINTNICKQSVLEHIATYKQDLKNLHDIIAKNGLIINTFATDIISSQDSVYTINEAKDFSSQDIIELRKMHTEADDGLYDYNIVTVIFTFIYAFIRIILERYEPNHSEISIAYFAFFTLCTVCLMIKFSKIRKIIKHKREQLDNLHAKITQIKYEKISSITDGVLTVCKTQPSHDDIQKPQEKLQSKLLQKDTNH